MNTHARLRAVLRLTDSPLCRVCKQDETPRILRVRVNLFQRDHFYKGNVTYVIIENTSVVLNL